MRSDNAAIFQFVDKADGNGVSDAELPLKMRDRCPTRLADYVKSLIPDGIDVFLNFVAKVNVTPLVIGQSGIARRWGTFRYIHFLRVVRDMPRADAARVTLSAYLRRMRRTCS